MYSITERLFTHLINNISMDYMTIIISQSVRLTERMAVRLTEYYTDVMTGRIKERLSDFGKILMKKWTELERKCAKSSTSRQNVACLLVRLNWHSFPCVSIGCLNCIRHQSVCLLVRMAVRMLVHNKRTIRIYFSLPDARTRAREDEETKKGKKGSLSAQILIPA